MEQLTKGVEALEQSTGKITLLFETFLATLTLPRNREALRKDPAVLDDLFEVVDDTKREFERIKGSCNGQI